MPTKIDWSSSIALENGTEAVVKRVRSNGSADVFIKGSIYRELDRGANESWCYSDVGIWSGDEERNQKWRIVNVDLSHTFVPEVWS